MHNKKFFSVIIALLVSVGLWVYVVTVENPVKDDLSMYGVIAEIKQILRML